MKRCSRCGIEKPLSEFPKRANRGNTPQPHCYECKKMINQEYHMKHGRPDRVLRSSGSPFFFDAVMEDRFLLNAY